MIKFITHLALYVAVVAGGLFIVNETVTVKECVDHKVLFVKYGESCVERKLFDL